MPGWGVTRTADADQIRALSDDEDPRARKKEQELVRNWILPDTPKRLVRERKLKLPDDLRVGVIGAGFAGLTAAWYLHELGVNVVVYEYSDHVGGRVLTDRTFVPGKNAEAGAELIGLNHAMWRRLARTFGLRLVELTSEEEYMESGLMVRLRFGDRQLSDSEKKQLKKKIERYLNLIGYEAKDINPSEPWMSDNSLMLDRMSVSKRFDGWFGTGPPDDVRRTLEFKIGNDNCAAPEQLSYLSLLTAVSAGRVGDDAEGLRGYWDYTETHRCGDGNQALANNLADVLGGRVRLGDPVASVKVVRLNEKLNTVLETKAGYRDDFTCVILSAPATVWDAIAFDPPLKQSELAISHGPAVKYMSRWADRFWEKSKFAPSALWDQLGSVWETTDRQDRSAPGHGLTVFSGGTYVLPRIDDYRRQLGVLYPNATDAEDERLVDWPNVPGILAGYAVPTVGQVTTVSKRLMTPHAGRIFFAGEQTSPGFYGYMEGALQSGGRAAREVIVQAGTSGGW
jgi:monoamine oxidase